MFGLTIMLALAPLGALEAPNSITLEILGKSSITADIAYERQLTQRLSLGAGAGVNGISRVDFVFDGTVYQAIDLAVPLNLYAVVRVAGDRHRLFVHFGMVAFTEFSLHRYRHYFTATPVPFVGLGYELHGQRFSFRVPLYVGYLGEPSEMLPGIMPWLGLSLAYSF
jgi:hypothetical protein